MLTIHFMWSFLKISPYFITIHLLFKIFGVFDGAYFTQESLVYGFMGNFLYSLFQVFQYLEDESEDIKPIPTKKWVLLVCRPFGAALFSFLLSACLVAGAGKLGENVLGFAQNSGTAIIVGILSGVFFDNLTNKRFLNTFFKQKIQNKIFDKE